MYVPAGGSSARFATTTSWYASYIAGRISWLNPASTLTKCRCAAFVELTRVSSTVESATSERPGSTQSAGWMPSASTPSTKTGITASAYSRGDGAVSSSWRYGIPSPPPRSMNSSVAPRPVTSPASRTMTRAASTNGARARICEPMWQWSPTGRTWSHASAAR